MDKATLKDFLDEKVNYFNKPSFIAHDPICIPHQFSKKQDIEIAGLFAALFAWGQRTTIINKSTELMERMDNAPFEFIKNHSPEDLKRLLGFKHRTFQVDDLLFLVHFLNAHYLKYESLEDAFLVKKTECKNLQIQEHRLRKFYTYVFSLEHLKRTEKHISTPAKNSACKRINMYLRWMVRQDNNGVDFGIWKNINPSELIIPLDVHVCRVATRLGLMKSEKSNWKEAVALTDKLRHFDSGDPVRYDFALFSMGIADKKGK